MNTKRYAALVCTLCLAVLSACATPPSVRNLAERTATNTGVISAQLNRLAQESGQLAELRAANITQLHAANTALRVRYNYDLALTKKSGAQTNLDLIPQLEAWLTEVDGILKASDAAEQERKATILATQTKLDTKSAGLGEIAQALATLAKEESVPQRASFLAGFAKQLKEEIDTQLDQSNKSATHAKKLLDELKKKF
jgi:hypothetical protein